MFLEISSLWADGEVNPLVGKFTYDGRLVWRKLSLVLGIEPMMLLVNSFWKGAVREYGRMVLGMAPINHFAD